MIITFQVQVDSNSDFGIEQLQTLEEEMNSFITKIQGYGYTRFQMWVNQKMYEEA